MGIPSNEEIDTIDVAKEVVTTEIFQFVLHFENKMNTRAWHLSNSIAI